MLTFGKIKSYSSEFWLINAMQFVEKLAYTSMLWQMPIYISQKDTVGGLQWGQEIKGTIFLIWAIVQNITPILTGGLPVRFGYKRIFIVSFSIILMSYLGLATQREIPTFTISVLFLGFGSGLLVPVIQGALAGIMKNENQSTGWGIYFMLINISVLIGGILSKYLKDFGWDTLFLFCGFLTLLNLIFTLFLFRNENYIIEHHFKNIIIKGLRILKERTYLAKFLIFMSGFTIVYMQFYETLPNFIVDWIDSSYIVEQLGLPDFMLMQTQSGKMISYEWLLNLNSILIIFFVVIISTYFFRKRILNSILIGIIIASFGLLLCSSSMSGFVLIAGIIIYTFGEMLVNPKFHKYFATISETEYKSIYMSFIKISFAVGLGLGGILGGYIYKYFGEKATLAKNYLIQNFNYDVDINLSFIKLQEILKLDAINTTKLLWDSYHPYIIFYPFAFVGILSIIGILSIRKQLNSIINYEQPLV